MMLGFQGSTPSKVYPCVACSATFNGLASLLVHQATHASSIPKIPPPPQTGINPSETQLDSSSERAKSLSRPPESSSSSFYICDCGEEFLDFNLMLDHKRSHISGHELNQPMDTTPSTSKSPVVESPRLSDNKPDVGLENEICMATFHQSQNTPCQDNSEEQFNILPTAEEMSTPGENCEDLEHSDSCCKKTEELPKKKNVMNLLASVYMKRFTGTQPSKLKHDTVTPKQEVVTVDILSEDQTQPSPVSDRSVAQLRRFLARPNKKTKAPSISRVLESSRKKVVSLTKSLSPVVVLETRQKLRDFHNHGAYGKYQCGRCRRVFDNVDRLTEHHFLHKKERIKCCRRCKQLIIGRMPLSDKHVCPQFGKRAINLAKPFMHKLSSNPKLVPFQSLSNTRKIFFCPLCKHSYARRWNLKNHKCQGSRSFAARQIRPSVHNTFLERQVSDFTADVEGSDESDISKSVGVGTEITHTIKEELTSADQEQPASSQPIWTNPAKPFPPFFATSSMPEHKDALMEKECLDENENSNEGQWTIPLDDEMQVYREQQKFATDENTGLRYFVSDGLKRFPCNRCQKTYSRPGTLNRHLRLCGFVPHASVAESFGPSALSASPVKPMFPCSVCGRSFNRKDNMMTHKKRCQLRHPNNGANTGLALPNDISSGTVSQTPEDDSSTWGIMSLPSVLPRRVTCECGVGFTSPRLLLEHLQKHAQESYTCPTCGETVNSWADYEVHLQIHMHPHNQLLKILQPQKSQPLLICLQQQRPQQQTSPTLSKPPQSPSVTVDKLPSPARKQQRISCMRCNSTFAAHCSLRRHLALNRCRGVRPTNPPTNPPKIHRCLHCNATFHNTIGLLFHQRSGTCKPAAIKPVRCPSCPRWFGTVDGLQKHLLTHKKKAESHHCDICQGTYPSLKSLKIHRRRIHRILVGKSRHKEQLKS